MVVSGEQHRETGLRLPDGIAARLFTVGAPAQA
jgi:hypothetical protein